MAPGEPRRHPALQGAQHAPQLPALHAFHHALHVHELLEEPVHVLDLDPGALDVEAKKIQRAFRKYKTAQETAAKTHQQRRGSLKRAPSFDKIPVPEDEGGTNKSAKSLRAYRNFKSRQEQAAVVIQSLYRAHRQRKLYLKQYTSLVSMQHHWRTKRAAMRF